MTNPVIVELRVPDGATTETYEHPGGCVYGFYVVVTSIAESESVPIYEWCVARFGRPDHKASWHFQATSEIFWFRDMNQAMEFKLRWC